MSLYVTVHRNYCPWMLPYVTIHGRSLSSLVTRYPKLPSMDVTVCYCSWTLPYLTVHGRTVRYCPLTLRLYVFMVTLWIQDRTDEVHIYVNVLCICICRCIVYVYVYEYIWNRLDSDLDPLQFYTHRYKFWNNKKSTKIIYVYIIFFNVSPWTVACHHRRLTCHHGR